MEMLGDRSIWDLPKTAFLCSRKVPAAQVLKCYDWAIAMREAGKCVMLGAHSQLETDVLHYLLKGTQPVVLVLARGMKKRMERTLVPEIENGRLLVIAPLSESVKRVTQETARLRNRFMLENAERVIVGHASEGGSITDLLSEHRGPVQFL